MPMKGYLFDRDLFRRLLDGQIDTPFFPPQARFFITEGQYEELIAAPYSKTREKLMLFLRRLEELDQSMPSLDAWGPIQSPFLLSRLRVTLMSDGHSPENTVMDAFLVETAIRNNLTLVTHDQRLFAVVTKFGGASANLCDILFAAGR